MMKIVVTGCAGFIGSNFSEYWLDRHAKDSIVGIDCLTYAANIPALEELKKREGFTFYRENICNREAIFRIFEAEKPDVVINFAAESHVDRSIESSQIFIESNVLGTQTLLDACVKFGIQRFHQISTDEVYGDLPLDSDERFTESSPLKPSSPYSASKAAADLLALSYFRTHGLPVSISRSSNNYGKCQHIEKLIPKAIRLASYDQPVAVYGDGRNARDWLHVYDHCCAIDLIVTYGRVGEIYNVGGNTVLSNIELVRKILSLLCRNTDLVEYVSDRPGHDRKYALDCTKLCNELSWSPVVTFDQGLKDTVSWYVNCFSNKG